MAESTIEWTDKVWNPIRGCTRVSEGCRHCYAERTAHRFSQPGQPYHGLTHLVGGKPQWTGQVQVVPEKLNEPLRWRKPARVFVNSMSDLFHQDVPDGFINDVFRVMIEAKRHTFQILTKRPERMRDYCSKRWGKFDGKEYPLASNIWLGVSVENQAAADQRIPLLLETPVAVRFLSCEPLLAPIRLRPTWLATELPCPGGIAGCEVLHTGPPSPISWVIIGGESGPGARPCELDWVRALVRQCQQNEVACFVKQLGLCASDPANGLAGRGLQVAGEALPLISLRLRDSHGGNMDEWPADLRIREFPPHQEVLP